MKLDSRPIALGVLAFSLGALPALPQEQPDAPPDQAELTYSFQVYQPPRAGASVGGINELLGTSNSGSMVNEFTGQAAFNVDLGGIGTVSGLNHSLSLGYYGGGTDAIMRAHPQYSPGSWVGAGFTLKAPYIQAAGENADISKQKYYLSLDGVSQQELIATSTADLYVPKNNPLIKVNRMVASRSHTLRDRCPSQSGTAVSFTNQHVNYWTLSLPDGTQYMFGSDLADCDEWELCQPLVGSAYKYKPFYTLETNGKAAVTFMLARIKDRQNRSALWFRYTKVSQNMIGGCNSVNTTPNSTYLDRALYLREIYATNGLLPGDPQTSRILLNTEDKTEEAVYPQVEANPTALYETKKLGSIQHYQNGIPTSILYLNYASRQGRMTLESIDAQAPEFSHRKRFLNVGYQENSIRVSSVEDAMGRIVEYTYGPVDATPVNSPSSDYQTLELPAQPQHSRIAMARQAGNKFYVQVENWGPNCQQGGSQFRERLYEYENNGTYWGLRRTWDAPSIACPTAMDFFMSPDGKYFIWNSYSGDNTIINVHDLTLEGTNTQVQTFTYTTTGGRPEHTDIYAYGDWFAAYNFTFKRNITFYRKSGSSWTSTCPADIAPGTYAANTNSPRTNNYSGEDEGIAAGTCLTFAGEIRPTPGPSYVVVNNWNLGIFHFFANNNGIKDFVKGLETTTPTLPKFTYPDQVGDQGLANLNRPWYRRTTGNVAYHNNGEQKFDRVGAGENIVALQYATGTDIWKYLYVLGWDGNQLRYLYDEALLADMNTPDNRDEIDLAVGPDYFLLKNFYESAGNWRGFFHYKVDLKTWTVTKTKLPGTAFYPVGEADYVMKASPDYFLLEAMNQTDAGLGKGNGPRAFTPALTTTGGNSSGSTIGGIHYPTKYDIRVFMLDGNRNPVDVTSEFARSEGGRYLMATNIAGQGDRILGVDTYQSGSQNITLGYSLYKRNSNAGSGAKWTRYGIPSPATAGADEYHSSRLVTGGVITTLFRKSNTEESFNGIRFYPDPAERVTSASNPNNLVQGATVVTAVAIKRNGHYSSGNQIQRIDLTYPASSPDGQAGPVLKNHLGGVPNFKYVKKEMVEGARVAGFRRDEYGARIAERDRSLIGTPIRNWTLPDKSTYKKAGGAWDSTYFAVSNIAGLPNDAFATRKVRDSSRTYFHQAWRPGLTYHTYYDDRNGKPKVTVSHNAGRFLVNLTLYEQDINTAYTGPNWDLVRQTATFQFSFDPCSRAAGATDPCGNINLAWFSDPIKQNIVASTILTYDAGRVKEIHEWRPTGTGQLGTIFPPLNGDPASTGANWKWVKVQSNTRWQDHAVAQCKSDMPTESERMGVYTTSFYGGSECDAIATVQNSRYGTAAVLTGEEQINTAHCLPGGCMGAFGRWEAGGATLQDQVAHTGSRAAKATALFGPSIDLKLREFPGFIDRKKGFVLSAWILATPNSNPAFQVEWRKIAAPPTINHLNDQVQGLPLDLVQEYIAANGSFPTDKWVKIERLITYAELTGRGIFGTAPGNHDYLRIWLGKGSGANTNAVYVDDVRLYPADATVTTRNFDGTGLMTSDLNGDNEPTYYEYDVWRSLIGTRRKDGSLQASSTVKLINE